MIREWRQVQVNTADETLLSQQSLQNKERQEKQGEKLPLLSNCISARHFEAAFKHVRPSVAEIDRIR